MRVLASTEDLLGAHGAREAARIAIPTTVMRLLVDGEMDMELTCGDISSCKLTCPWVSGRCNRVWFRDMACFFEHC